MDNPDNDLGNLAAVGDNLAVTPEAVLRTLEAEANLVAVLHILGEEVSLVAAHNLVVVRHIPMVVANLAAAVRLLLEEHIRMHKANVRLPDFFVLRILDNTY